MGVGRERKTARLLFEGLALSRASTVPAVREWRERVQAHLRPIGAKISKGLVEAKQSRDSRAPVCPPGARPPLRLQEERAKNPRIKNRCIGCQDKRGSGKSFSGPHYCVTCGQLGYKNGWCGCLAPLYGNGRCKRARLCLKRDAEPYDLDALPSDSDSDPCPQRDEKPPRPKRTSRGLWNRCPNCGFHYQPDSKNCDNCGQARGNA